MNTDGTIEDRRYDTPTGLVDYLSLSSGAVLRGVFYIFGGSKGTNNYKKVNFSKISRIVKVII